MKKLAYLGLILGGIALALFFTFRALFGGETVAWHQRLTVTVQTPAGEVSGDAVTAVTKVDTDGALVLPQARGVRSKIQGEAVVVEIAPGKYLFALLGGASHWTYPAFGLGQGRSYEDSMDKLMGIPHDTPSPLPQKDYPLLVTFTDINDPTTVTRVDPANLAATFGPGISLTSVTLAVTEDPVTEGRVEAVLECIRSHTSCVPLNLTLPYGHPMRNVPNNEFMRTIKMTISKELYLAILSMDAYNRGYGAGIADGGENDPDGLGLGGSIGAASIKTRDKLGVSVADYAAWQTAGFYAVAYTMGALEFWSLDPVQEFNGRIE